MHSRRTLQRIVLRVTMITIVACIAGKAGAQAGLRAALEALDKNEDGTISQDEITPLARPYMEKIAKSRRMSLERPNGVDDWVEASRVYHALRNGVSDERVSSQPNEFVTDFQPRDEDRMVPEFGLSEMRYPYTGEDVEDADRSLRRNDHNGDGVIDQEEARDGRWLYRNPFEMDLNRDGKLDRMELIQRYARRRMLDAMTDEIQQKQRRVGTGIERTRTSGQSQDRKQGDWWRDPSHRNHLTNSVIRRFDANRNGRLEPQEAALFGVPAGRVDMNLDGELTYDEINVYLNQLEDESGADTAGLPSWFFEYDTNGDSQVSMLEFSEEWNDGKFAEFAVYDTNGDGLLTASEANGSTAIQGGSYSNETGEILPPHKTVISEIEVSDDFVIADLNVQISITHTNCSFLDGYLIGPDGQRIELFTAVGGGDDHFEDTIFDDQSRFPIVKARPPFRGTFMPEGLTKRQPGLSHFNDKSVKGVWQLVISGTRSERFGMLHGWNLRFKPRNEIDAGTTVAPPQDGPRQDRGYEDRRAKAIEDTRRREMERKDKESKAYLKRGGDVKSIQRSDGEKKRWDASKMSPEEREKLEQKKREWAEKYRKYLDSRGDGKDGKKGKDDQRRQKYDEVRKKLDAKLK